MSRYIFQSTNNIFKSETAFLKHLKYIRDTANINPNGVVLDKNHINELKDFIQDYYCDRENILSKFDLNNCEFFVALPPQPRNSHKCLWIKEKNGNQKQHFSTTKNGLIEPTPFDNFYRFCTNQLIPIKLQLRDYFTNQLNLSYDAFDLWHKQPKTKQLVIEFINLKEIHDKLEKVISPNGLGNNVPYLMLGYEHLKQDFIDFYQQKVALGLNFELKPRKH